MTVWRPSPHIKVKALGLHWRGDDLLAVEVYDDDGQLTGVRPLGGGVEFGETWQQALIREFREELHIDIRITGSPMVMENIYVHHGQTGHEALFLADVQFPDDAFAGLDEVKFLEDNGNECTARWFPLADLDGPGPSLFPAGIRSRLVARA
ncbi:NUDIX hydrolase [Tropicibacter sp. R16_0]|uniref:NUDIX hydrolase n=1 Tax=Tropicibacter sp. R16_0 TaxID=2821102 RepID=UPI001AD9FB86|nr:NUDIX hydrolase [Tropicibacter sp. R16_0]MBO9450739.1 NUDIX hydrolase [Tropicibacter sp. R16_0]